MTEPAIRVEGVSKRYRLGTGFEGALSQRIDAAIKAPFRALSRNSPEPAHEEEEFWALRDVSLEVEEGEALGVIGPNGAGKSTLLKLLSNITLPTEGRISLRGRVGTLLEVGTGFHPELTGRENVFLNGAILGMRRQEIGARFAEIVEFSGIEQFLDTPVKRYSSGMHVRLAFAVAAFLEPEIMLVDEVLSVGDTEFQRKCMGKMSDVSGQEGRTVVFVSHNLASVQQLCSRAVWIDHSRVIESGPSADVVAAYLRHVGPEQRGGEAIITDSTQRIGTGAARLTRAAMRDESGRLIDHVEVGQPWSLDMTFEVHEAIENVVVEVGVCDANGARVMTAMSGDDGVPLGSLKPGTYEITVAFDVTLLPGDFWIDIGIEDKRVSFDTVPRVINFGAINVPHRGAKPHPWDTSPGGVRPTTQWSVALAEDRYTVPTSQKV